MNEKSLITAILERLSKVIDPETGVDVVRMRLIEDLQADQEGHVSYKIPTLIGIVPASFASFP